MLIQNEYGHCEYVLETDKHGDYYHIYNLYIKPDYRKQGHAKNILEQVISKIRKTGYNGEIAIVPTPKENSISVEKLIGFYESLGLTVYEPRL